MSPSERHERNVDSDAAAQLRKVKRALVLDLFLRRGEFWKAISYLRTEWSIEAPVELPQRKLLGEPPHPQYWTTEHQSEDWVALSSKWRNDLCQLVFGFVPERFQDLNYYLLPWLSFFAVCVLFDPPETTEDEPCALLRFAEYGGLLPYKPDANAEHEKAMGAPRVYFPAVKEMRDWLVAEDMVHDYYNAMLSKIRERMEPTGVDFESMLREVLPELRNTLEDRHVHNPFRTYVEVDEYTTEADLLKAFRMLRRQQGVKPKGGAPARDPLTAVQAAILHDRHNPRDPQDGRRRLWTYVRLARELGLPVREKRIEYAGRHGRKEVSESAEEHVKLGRKFMKEFRTG